MGVVAKAHLIYGYRVQGERMRKIWHNISEDEYDKLVDDELDCQAIYGYDGMEYIGYEIQSVNEDSEPVVLTDRDKISQELKTAIKEFAARAFGEPNIPDPEYFLVCLCH